MRIRYALTVAVCAVLAFSSGQEAFGGYLYGPDEDYFGELLRIDPATGAIVEILIQTGALHGRAARVGGLAYVPEPATLSLLLIGGLALFRRRSK